MQGVLKLTVKISAADRDAIRHAARSQGLSISEFVGTAARSAVRRAELSPTQILARQLQSLRALGIEARDLRSIESAAEEAE